MICMFRFETAGESHGECLVATVTGMPAGIPVGTLAIGRAGAINAALLATAILARKHTSHRAALARFREEQTSDVLAHPDPREKA